jgi:hypothetical protein
MRGFILGARMFTDQPITPTRLECLIDLLREHSRRTWTSNQVADVLQPKGLPDISEASRQAKLVVRAGIELELVVEDEGRLKLREFDRRQTTRSAVELAFDRVVLESTNVEPYYSPFYAFLLHHGTTGCEKWTPVEWANAFNVNCPTFARAQNPFNQPKYTGLLRWFAYSGHGWFDPAGRFQPNPYGRLRRQLSRIFDKALKLSDTEFMNRLGLCCPELDTGEIFRASVPSHNSEARTCSLGLSHALIDLHLDGQLRLYCTADSRGWDVGAAQPPNDGNTLRGTRIDYVEYIK